MKLFVLMLVCCGGLLTADEHDLTNHFTNGRGWIKFSSAMKAAYLVGLDEATTLTGLRCAEPLGGFDVATIPPGVTLGEVAQSLDLFFNEPTNRNIPVAYALRYVKRKAEGAKDAELKDLESTLRQQWSLIH